MYAENNFYDNNLDASGQSADRRPVFGNMTAGNHVAINRDWDDQHSKLTVDFDDRVWTGSVTLPGLPDQSGGGGGVQILSWREVPTPAAMTPAFGPFAIGGGHTGPTNPPGGGLKSP